MSESAIPVECYRALEPTDATLVLVENGNEIIFYYQKLTSYTIHYVDMFTGESIYASKSVIEIPIGAVITEEVGISMSTAKKAKRMLGVVSSKPHYSWYWRLPEDED